MNTTEIIATALSGVGIPTISLFVTQCIKIFANYKANKIKKSDMKVLAREIVDYANEIGAEINIDFDAEFNKLTQGLVKKNNKLLEKTSKNINIQSQKAEALYKCVEPLRTLTEENKKQLKEAFEEKEEVIEVEEKAKVKLGKKKAVMPY